MAAQSNVLSLVCVVLTAYLDVAKSRLLKQTTHLVLVVSWNFAHVQSSVAFAFVFGLYDC